MEPLGEQCYAADWVSTHVLLQILPLDGASDRTRIMQRKGRGAQVGRQTQTRKNSRAASLAFPKRLLSDADLRRCPQPRGTAASATRR